MARPTSRLRWALPSLVVELVQSIAEHIHSRTCANRLHEIGFAVRQRPRLTDGFGALGDQRVNLDLAGDSEQDRTARVDTVFQKDRDPVCSAARRRDAPEHRGPGRAIVDRTDQVLDVRSRVGEDEPRFGASRLDRLEQVTRIYTVDQCEGGEHHARQVEGHLAHVSEIAGRRIQGLSPRRHCRRPDSWAPA